MRLCAHNPNREYKNGMLGKKGANAYTKARREGRPDPIVSAETRRKIGEKSAARQHSLGTKEKISKHRIAYLRENPDMVPYKLNHYSKGPSYAETYWKEVLDNNALNYVEQLQIGPYQLDFAFLDKKIDLEIDGEQHYVDKRVVASDERRNIYLNELGWHTIRVRWSVYQKLDLTERQLFVTNIVQKLE